MGTRCTATACAHDLHHSGSRCRRRVAAGDDCRDCHSSLASRSHSNRRTRAQHRKAGGRMSTAAPTQVPRPVPVLARAGVLFRDYSELIKLRVTSLIVLSAWAGAYFAAPRAGVSELSWTVLYACIGISLIAAGSAALNEVFEKDVDALMHRTAHRPLPAKRMGIMHAATVSGVLVFGGALYLAIYCNLLTGCLALATAIVYL